MALRILMIALLITTASCAASEEATDGGDRPTKNRSFREGFYLEPPREDVKTVQVYGTGNEAATPLIRMGTGETITLAFDLMTADAYPVSVYFYHTNRNWRRDLVSAEYMSSFHRDDVLDYRPSRATDLQYTHYAYEFPNSVIDFRLSGNYVLRVTEQGLEDNVILERPFFVSEQATGVDVQLDNVMVAGRSYTSVQPYVRFAPHETSANAFDYTVCFVRNDRYDAARCAIRPSLATQPNLSYFLEPENSFAPEPANYFLDLSEIRVSNRIEFTDLSVQPPEAALAPDYAVFAGSGVAPFINGQTIVESVVRNVMDPDVSAEYVRVFFRFVPVDETRPAGRVVVTGSFNNWAYEEQNEMLWDARAGRYEGEVLLKQGHYEYRYLAEDNRLRDAMNSGLPRFQNLYTTFIYYSDMRMQTDRLISATGVFVK